MRAAVEIAVDMARQGLNGDCALNSFREEGSLEISQITRADITSRLRKTTSELGEARLGVKVMLITPHSLRAGGAVLMMMLNVDRIEIMARGRWKSDAVMVYLSCKLRDNRASCYEQMELMDRDVMGCKGIGKKRKTAGSSFGA